MKIMTRLQRVPCEWVIPTSKGPRACTFQGATKVLGHSYCKTHAKHVRKLMPSEDEVQTAKLAAEQRLVNLRALPRPPSKVEAPLSNGVGATAESLDVAQAILLLAKQGASASSIAFLIDGFVSNVMRMTLQAVKPARLA